VLLLLIWGVWKALAQPVTELGGMELFPGLILIPEEKSPFCIRQDGAWGGTGGSGTFLFARVDGNATNIRSSKAGAKSILRDDFLVWYRDMSFLLRFRLHEFVCFRACTGE
jgi:hypothetical protein